MRALGDDSKRRLEHRVGLRQIVVDDQTARTHQVQSVTGDILQFRRIHQFVDRVLRPRRFALATARSWCGSG